MAARVRSGQAAQTALYERVLAAAAAAHEEMRRQDPEPVIAAAAAMAKAVRGGGKVLMFGNGGSAADAQHMAAELGELGRRADVHMNVPGTDTARAQEVHRTLLHILCELVELELQGTM